MDIQRARRRPVAAYLNLWIPVYQVVGQRIGIRTIGAPANANKFLEVVIPPQVKDTKRQRHAGGAIMASGIKLPTKPVPSHALQLIGSSRLFVRRRQ